MSPHVPQPITAERISSLERCTRCKEPIFNAQNAVIRPDGMQHEPCSHVPRSCAPLIKFGKDSRPYLVGYTQDRNSRSRKRLTKDVHFNQGFDLEEPVPRRDKNTGRISTDPLKGIPKKQRRRERELVKAWKRSSDAAVEMGGTPTPMSVLIPIPPDRIQAYLEQLWPPTSPTKS